MGPKKFVSNKLPYYPMLTLLVRGLQFGDDFPGLIGHQILLINYPGLLGAFLKPLSLSAILFTKASASLAL